MGFEVGLVLVGRLVVWNYFWVMVFFENLMDVEERMYIYIDR